MLIDERSLSLAIVHPVPIIRYGIARIMHSSSVASYQNLRSIKRGSVDVVITDIVDLPGIAYVSKWTPVVCITAHNNNWHKAIINGASAVLAFTTDEDEIKSVILGAANRIAVVTQDAVSQVLDAQNAVLELLLDVSGDLNRTELSILRALRGDKTLAQVADEIGLAHGTVKNAVHTMKEKLNIKTLSGLAVLSYRIFGEIEDD